MRIAFTAPMKPLDDPTPSGDRTMGRLIVKALESHGHEVRIATRFRSWRAQATPKLQQQIKREALKEAAAVAEHWRAIDWAPELFLTYHLYHKAPDWIGPALADEFAVPYMVVEASRAPKRQNGPWEVGFSAADQALARADCVAAMHEADAQCLRDVVGGERLQLLPPFLGAASYLSSQRGAPPAGAPMRLLTAAMMRPGDKSRSYEVLAQALSQVEDPPWSLTIAGDGPAREEILALFPPQRTAFVGAVPPEEMPALYAAHDILVWPAIREAFGFVFLEAQAAGCAIVGGDAFGVPDIVRHGETGLLSPEGDADAFARNLRKLLNAPELTARMGAAARKLIASRHDISSGGRRLDELLAIAVKQHDLSPLARADRFPSFSPLSPPSLD